MNKTTLLIAGLLMSFGLGYYINNIIAMPGNRVGYSHINSNKENAESLKLGAFSVSLSVRDLNASKEFYENLGFTVFGGNIENKYLIMKNENSLIGLFHGMFEGNILTFNPGWDENATNIEKFDDVREIQRQLKSKGFSINNEADEKTSGPASFMITDPDGNVILVDQHR
jgi:catechol 2,3-dioxygenase-like lactoylglutathione lyase family enzyme